MSESQVADLLGRSLSEQERTAIVQPLLARGVSPQGVVEALRTMEKTPEPQDRELRTIRYEAIGDTLYRIADIGASPTS